MDFAAVLETVSEFLNGKGFRYAVIGGVALAAYGLSRTTLDLDLVVEGEAQEDLIPFLESLGFATLHRSPGYSNHLHPDPARGRLDFAYVRGGTSEKLFAACSERRGPQEKMIPVPKPEHLAAMKVLAFRNDPARTFQDMADIRFLLTLPGVDRAEVRGSFERHGLGERFDEIERTL